MREGIVRAVQRARLGRWLRLRWQLVFGLGLSALCLALAFRGISFSNLGKALTIVRWKWMALTPVSVLVAAFVKTLRWRVLLLPQRVSLGRAWSVFVIGQMLNAVLPGRVGEIGRIYLIGKDGEVARVNAFSTIVVEKIADLVMLALAYVLVAIRLTSTPAGFPAWLQDAGKGLSLLAISAVGILLVFMYAGRALWRPFRQIFRPLPERWQSVADAGAGQVLRAFEALRLPWVSVRVWSWSLAVWALGALTNALTFRAFQLSLPSYVSLFLLVVLMSGVSVPPLPGNLGVFPYLCMLVLSLFDIDRETALAFGICLQLAVYLPVIVVGSACMLRNNLARARPPKAGREDVEC